MATRALSFFTFRFPLPRSPPPSFAADIDAGLSSETFDLHANIDEKDGRPGVDGDEVRGIMRKMRCSFDQARLLRQRCRMLEAGIDPDTGIPLDPKAVFFR